jgi:hypothetical protein
MNRIAKRAYCLEENAHELGGENLNAQTLTTLTTTYNLGT